ncbi:hypothetical protein K488DRAFT_76778 [Vararia minispora EC-137]|uniref:Uncharacterized protein n=1 Tax=Vararia minispora EC-137 TaxID=1314806 RepID=A0ACB8QTP4_9AGAM|nr:hypothetical protein K488DRAFT_76778 [Vararia minispora EC-137]
MRAVLVKDGKGPIENLYIGEVPEPALGDGDVKVKVKAFGLNRADCAQRMGSYPGLTSDAIMGLEFSGIVVDVAPGVSGFKSGDEVLGLTVGGAYAEYISVHASTVLKKASHLSWAEAAGIPEAFLTAYGILKRTCELKEGDNVLIHAGASGVGIAAIQLARYFGAKTVIATASTKDKLGWLLSIPFGATHVSNYKTENFVDVVKQATDGHGADVVVDPVGQSHWHQNIDALATDGRMGILALMSGSVVKDADLKHVLFKRLRIQGSTLRWRDKAYKEKLVGEFSEIMADITGISGNGKLRVYIHKVYPWAEIQAATREMEDNKNIGKIIAEVV